MNRCFVCPLHFQVGAPHGWFLVPSWLPGDRLRYAKLSGKGPSNGWVSIRLRDKVLLRERGEMSKEEMSENREVQRGGDKGMIGKLAHLFRSDWI